MAEQAITSPNSEDKKPSTLAGILASPDIKSRFSEILGQKAPGFLSSILSLYNSKKELKDCEPNSVVAAAAVAATLDLPINQNLGFAFIVPYSGRAQFQMGSKGFIQLAQRTGQYKTIHATEVYKDEIKRWDALTGTFEATEPDNHKMRVKANFEDVAGYLAYFKTIGGFEKWFYMTVDQLKVHGKKYSKSYAMGMWTQNPHVMMIKTVTKLLLSKYGPLSVQQAGPLRTAIDADQAVIDTDGTYIYPDRAEEQPVASKPTGAEKKINEDQFRLLAAEQQRAEKRGIEKDEQTVYMKQTFGVEHRHDLTVEQLTQYLKWLRQEPEAAA